MGGLFVAGAIAGFAVGLAIGMALLAARAARAAKRESDLTTRLAVAESKLASAPPAERLLDETADALANGFEALGRRALAEATAPLGEALQRIEVQRAAAEAALSAQLERLAGREADLAREAASLSRALRAPNARGRWGELQLRRVVELAGMLSRCDFDEQPTLTGPNGEKLRPDVVVHLPGGGHVAIDAKAPLDAWLAALEAPDETGRKQAQAAHARHLRGHVDALAGRAYWSALPTSPELVVLFVPGDGPLAAALDADPVLLDDAAAAGVLLATPVTLIAILRAIAAGWQRREAADNAEEILAAGRDLHDRLRVAMGHLATLRKGLGGAVEAFNRAVAGFESRVTPAAARLAALGSIGPSLGESLQASLEPTLQAIDEPLRHPRGGISIADGENR